MRHYLHVHLHRYNLRRVLWEHPGINLQNRCTLMICVNDFYTVKREMRFDNFGLFSIYAYFADGDNTFNYLSNAYESGKTFIVCIHYVLSIDINVYLKLEEMFNWNEHSIVQRKGGQIIWSLYGGVFFFSCRFSYLRKHNRKNACCLFNYLMFWRVWPCTFATADWITKELQVNLMCAGFKRNTTCQTMRIACLDYWNIRTIKHTDKWNEYTI